jgi:hypothetical protein
MQSWKTTNSILHEEEFTFENYDNKSTGEALLQANFTIKSVDELIQITPACTLAVQYWQLVNATVENDTNSSWDVN